MPIDQKLTMDVVKQKLLLTTEIPRSELCAAFNEKGFYGAVYSKLAMKVADHLFEQIGPALDEVLRETLK